MTDIEGSTRLLQALGDRYPAVLADHYRVLREAFRPVGGVEVDTQGDALFYAFTNAPSAVRAAVDGQRQLAAHAWPEGAAIRVRMGIHSGQGTVDAESYVGLDVHRTARISAAGHGGQILVSDATRALAEAGLPDEMTLRDLGRHWLKDLERAEHLFQLCAPGLEDGFPPLRSMDARRHNLPAQVTSFVGRDRERRRVIDLLDASRLLTLTGPGGTGKTRLALDVAEGCVDRFADGVQFVALATISEAELVVPTVAAVFNIREGPARSVRDALVEYLAGLETLLVLDNFEQVVQAAPVVGDVLAATPGVKVLVTSREALRIAGEQEYPVPPLALPAGSARTSVDELRDVDSVSLFVQRARLARPDFELTEDNAASVAQICARLDGLPLALELAAARVRLFAPVELLRRLDRNLDVLAGGRDLPDRQRTLRGAIDWSYELLDPAEQALFRRLSVFAGGCTIEAVETVGDPSGLGLDPIEGVASLHDKSLLLRDDTAEEFRVGMLETIREYGRHRLAASGEEPEITARHSAFFVEFTEHAAGELHGPDQQEWFAALDAELDNIRAAIRLAITSNQPASGLRIAGALQQFWLSRNHTREGRRYLEQLLSLPSDRASRAARAAALDAAAGIASWQGDYAALPSLSDEALEIYRELGDNKGIADQLSNLGWGAAVADPQAALALFEESIALYRSVGSPAVMAGSLAGQGVVHIRRRNLDDAVNSLDEAVELARQAGDEEFMYIPIGLRGLAARLQGDLIGARGRYVEVLERSHRSASHIGLTMALVMLADLANVDRRPEEAAVLCGAMARLAELLGGIPPSELTGTEDPAEVARAQLGDQRYEAAVARGRAMPLDEVIALAVSV